MNNRIEESEDIKGRLLFMNWDCLNNDNDWKMEMVYRFGWFGCDKSGCNNGFCVVWVVIFYYLFWSDIKKDGVMVKWLYCYVIDYVVWWFCWSVVVVIGDGDGFLLRIIFNF